uniref:Uncharacterized protein n=1 Tax=Anguilla anguilla TaxID=7936 RepID=A0A0E9ULW8_ANGAN
MKFHQDQGAFRLPSGGGSA